MLGPDGVIASAEKYLATMTYAGRAVNTVRAKAHDLALWFRFLEERQLEWASVSFDDLGRFLGWLQLPEDRAGVVVALNPEPRRSVATVSRALASVFGFYDFHAMSGAKLSKQLTEYSSMRARRDRVRASSKAHRRPITILPEARLPKMVSREDAVRLFDACDLLRDRLLLAMWWGAALRVGQTLGLRHEDVDARRRELRIVRRDNGTGAWSKSRREWVVPISDEIVRLHRDYMFEEYGDIDSDFVFIVLSGPTRGSGLTPDAVAKMVLRLRKRSGVWFTPHMMRHSYATDFVASGGRLEALSEQMTHSSTASTRPYLHLAPEAMREELERRRRLS